MIWTFGIWFVGFVLCVLFAAIRVYREGRFSLRTIFEYLPVCVASWITILCDAAEYFFVGDIEFWTREVEDKE